MVAHAGVEVKLLHRRERKRQPGLGAELAVAATAAVEGAKNCLAPRDVVAQQVAAQAGVAAPAIAEQDQLLHMQRQQVLRHPVVTHGG